VDRDRLVALLAATFGSLALVLGAVAVVFEPLVLVLAIPFGVVGYVMWYQASGRLARRIYAGVEDRARVEDGRRARRAGRGRSRNRQRSRGARAGRQRRGDGGHAREVDGAPRGADALTEREACDRLGVEPGADGATIRRAYRERVKEVHPDRGGDEEAFKRVAAAYDRLTD